MIGGDAESSTGGLDQPEDPQAKALFDAADRGDEAQVRALLESGAPVNGVASTGGLYPLTGAIKHPAIAQLLLDAGADANLAHVNKSTALDFAAHEGDPAVVDLLIQRGAPVNRQAGSGLTPLHSAAATMEDRSEVITVLLRAGADIEARDDKGHTPLHAAALSATPGNVGALLSAGANVNAAMEDGSLPLHLAAACLAVLPGVSEVVRLLVAAGANLDVADELGMTPLHWAAFRGNGEVATILVEAGADTKKKDQSGHTPPQVEPTVGADALDWEGILAARPRRGLFGRRK